jgi:hypothetical protein
MPPAGSLALNAGRSLEGSIELMGAPMAFARNSEIYGEGEPAD